MTVAEYKKGVAGRGLLTSQEEQSILFCLVRPGSWLPSHLDRMRAPLSIPRRWDPRSWLSSHLDRMRAPLSKPRRWDPGHGLTSIWLVGWSDLAPFFCLFKTYTFLSIMYILSSSIPKNRQIGRLLAFRTRSKVFVSKNHRELKNKYFFENLQKPSL